MHSGERPYACAEPGCSFAATRSDALTLHARTHSGARPYVCAEPGCPYAAKESGKLAIHARTHSGMRPYACAEPGCVYAAKSSKRTLSSRLILPYMPALRFLLLALAFALIRAGAAQPTVLISGSLSTPPPSFIPNVFSTLTAWDPAQFAAAPPPADFAARYPFLAHVEFFTATGGCYAAFPGCASDRDLLNDPADARSGVNATRLFAPLRHVLAAGLKPHIVTGNVPISFSAPPALGGFGVNAALPANLSAYAECEYGARSAHLTTPACRILNPRCKMRPYVPAKP